MLNCLPFTDPHEDKVTFIKKLYLLFLKAHPFEGLLPVQIKEKNKETKFKTTR